MHFLTLNVCFWEEQIPVLLSILQDSQLVVSNSAYFIISCCCAYYIVVLKTCEGLDTWGRLTTLSICTEPLGLVKCLVHMEAL